MQGKNLKISAILQEEIQSKNSSSISVYYQQMKMANLFPSGTGTLVPEWQWQDCSQVTLA